MEIRHASAEVNEILQEYFGPAILYRDAQPRVWKVEFKSKADALAQLINFAEISFLSYVDRSESEQNAVFPQST